MASRFRFTQLSKAVFALLRQFSPCGPNEGVAVEEVVGYGRGGGRWRQAFSSLAGSLAIGAPSPCVVSAAPPPAGVPQRMPP